MPPHAAAPSRGRRPTLRRRGHADDDAPRTPRRRGRHEPGGRGQAPRQPAAGVVDPMQWWGALTKQFTELATNAMKDTAADAAREPAPARGRSNRSTPPPRRLKSTAGRGAKAARRDGKQARPPGKRAAPRSAEPRIDRATLHDGACDASCTATRRTPTGASRSRWPRRRSRRSGGEQPRRRSADARLGLPDRPLRAARRARCWPICASAGPAWTGSARSASASRPAASSTSTSRRCR